MVKQAILLIMQQSTWHPCALIGQQFLLPSLELFLSSSLSLQKHLKTIQKILKEKETQICLEVFLKDLGLPWVHLPVSIKCHSLLSPSHLASLGLVPNPWPFKERQMLQVHQNPDKAQLFRE